MTKKIGVAIIGNGMRSKDVVSRLLISAAGNLEICSLYDPDPAMMEDVAKMWEAPHALRAASSQMAIAAPGVDWVLIFSPNAFHKEHILEAFAAGKNVFSEKPLATTIEDCQAIYSAHQASGKLFATGFVLRYTVLYRKVKELLDSGRYGKLLSVEGNEHIAPSHGGYIMTNWRRHRALAGPHILEKCCHDLDLIEWFTGSLPSEVSAFAGRKFFVPANDKLRTRFPKMFDTWPDPHRIATPFNDDSDMDDEIFSIARFRNGVHVTFNATMSNVKPERRLRFHCETGTLTAELYSMTLTAAEMGSGVEESWNFGCEGGHAGGDLVIAAELYDSMANGTTPKCSGAEGLQSAVYALALDRAAHEKRIIDLEPVWQKLGR